MQRVQGGGYTTVASRDVELSMGDHAVYDSAHDSHSEDGHHGF